MNCLALLLKTWMLLQARWALVSERTDLLTEGTNELSVSFLIRNRAA